MANDDPRVAADASAGNGLDAALPRPVQEHLARQLRAEYHVEEDKPAFLGDTALPVSFDEPLQRLEEKEREKIHQRGVDAVEAALGPVVDTGKSEA